jgi:hypothetical protein
MPSFDDLFSGSKGRPVFYKGHALWRVDRLDVPDGQRLRVTFESINSDWRQGISLKTDVGFEFNNQLIKKPIAIWQDTAPRETELTVRTKTGECLVKNMWDSGNGGVHFWHNGAAMIVEEIPGGKRYRCNDGHPDENFDDLVFTIEMID